MTRPTVTNAARDAAARPATASDRRDRIGAPTDRDAAMPRVLILNRSFYPDTEATGQLLTTLCRGLAVRYEIEVIAGHPNHVQTGDDSTGSASDESISTVPNTGGFTLHAPEGAIEVCTARHTRFAKTSLVGRAANFVSFVAMALVTALRRPKADVVVCETDPFLLLLIGPLVARRHGAKFVAYLQDIYPDVAVAVGKVRERAFTRWLRRRLVAACNRAERVVVLSEDMRDRCIRNGVRPTTDDGQPRIAIVPNWTDCQAVYPIKSNNRFRHVHDLEDAFVVMYSGNLGMAHLIEPLVDVAEDLSRSPVDGVDVQFVLIGEGARKAALQQAVAERGLTNVRFLTYQPRETLAESLSAADVHLVTMKPETAGCVVPSKLYGALASGTAVVVAGPEQGDLARVVRDADAGLVVAADPSETLPRRLAGAIRTLAANPEATAAMGQRARHVCERDYDAPSSIAAFDRVLRGALGRPLATPPVEASSVGVVEPAAVLQGAGQ